MGWKSRVLFGTLVAGGFVSLGSGFMKLSPKDFQLSGVPKPNAAALNPEKLKEHLPENALNKKRYVQIEGKLYEYNPKHTYMVNGVQTYYINGNVEGGDTKEGAVAKQVSMGSAVAEKVSEMAEKSSLSVYSPGGTQKLIDAAKTLRDDSQKRLQNIDQLAE